MIYYSLAKQFRNIILPISLALVALLTVVGPWSAYSLSKYSQNARLEAIAANTIWLRTPPCKNRTGI